MSFFSKDDQDAREKIERSRADARARSEAIQDAKAYRRAKRALPGSLRKIRRAFRKGDGHAKIYVKDRLVCLHLKMMIAEEIPQYHTEWDKRGSTDPMYYVSVNF